ncbi:uncharacterized protein K441DRAFT_652569 [Cenococcum geophilum 1.58]|uniref:uncharacterized protein n=1 Tax=Cenococcum geophilum 1.58 TaxID=794803 RepID=UPI00358EE5FB|nr:hypothetical protein K441DRAFT_652569 [Cenococcum geophilum 1.58]
MNVKPPNAHGIMVDGVIRRTPGKAISRELPRPGSSPLRATAVAVTHSDSCIHVAYLAKSSVYIYKLDVNEQSASLEREVLLPQPHGWQGIAIAGNFLAAWGFYSHERQLHMLDVRESQRQTSLPRLYDVKMLVRVAVSKSGAAALISSQQILVVKIEDQTWSPPLVPQPGQNFTDAAFNDTGDLLHAWAYGKNDSIYVWRCKDCVVNAKPESETHYKTEKIGKPYLTRVVPYNAYQGCIIAAQEKRFFAARLGSATTSLRESSASTAKAASQPLQHNAKIVDAKAACVFCDHSLITVERRWHGSVLKEYRVEYSGKNAELGTGVEICKLDTGREESARLVVGEWGDNVMAVVCNLNAVVEFVKIVPV